MDTPTIIFFSVFTVLALHDGLRPARRYPATKAWKVRGLVFLTLSLWVSSTVATAWGEWLGEFQGFDLGSLGPWWGAAVGLVVLEFGIYWWHRALHGVPWLWRFHRMHHSAESLDVYGAYLFHPVDMIGFTTLASVGLVSLGLSPGAAVAAAACADLLGLFQHANIRTPRWIGYLVQRPEAHEIHHGQGIHSGNFSDLPLWDLIFGTFRDPEILGRPAACGFRTGDSLRIFTLLFGGNLDRRSTVERRYDESDGGSLRRAGTGTAGA